ncbi:head-tail connector protein [Bradyrhizobium barranii subsp. barranii]|uniref:Head-tail connector protein n=1 Tax=Bradyrhizobium barranii subsp. barranii TaxID=2823807 RepID=A0A939MA31_9BRAD|nr:head-tail connector protein [Bradyrhizobium barranii]UEM09020.1 head-tail connector protein [Bradyrhizobium barranii subsp. barranii]
MTAILITAPDTDVLTRDEVKRHLRVDFDDDNDLIDGMTQAAVDQVDPAGGGWLGRALRPQTWELQLAGFWQADCCSDDYPLGAIVLPYPPLISIDSVTYLDSAGATQTLASVSGYRVLGQGSIKRQAIAPPFGQSWPATRNDAGSVKIRFTCGYPVANPDADPAVVDRLPAPVKAWLKLYIGALYQNRESFVSDSRQQVVELPAHIMQMISTSRIYG